MPEYAVLDKDTIKNRIMPYLSVAKRGYTSQFDLVEVVNAILYKLNSYPEMVQVACSRLQAIGYVPDGIAAGELTEYHTDQLVPCAISLTMLVRTDS